MVPVMISAVYPEDMLIRVHIDDMPQSGGYVAGRISDRRLLGPWVIITQDDRS